MCLMSRHAGSDLTIRTSAHPAVQDTTGAGKSRVPLASVA